jgi:hypothetical protein
VSVDVTEPVVISSESIKESSPVQLKAKLSRHSSPIIRTTYIVATLHAGFHYSKVSRGVDAAWDRITYCAGVEIGHAVNSELDTYPIQFR